MIEVDRQAIVVIHTPIQGKTLLDHSFYQPTLEKPLTELTDREKTILMGFGKGLSAYDIARQTGITRPYIQLILRKIKLGTGANTAMGAVINALNQGLITASEMVPEDFNPYIFSELTPHQRTALGAYYKEADSVRVGQMAISLDYTPEEFSENLSNAVKVIGAKNTTQAAVFLYRAIEVASQNPQRYEHLPKVLKSIELGIKGSLDDRERDVLVLRAQGLSNHEIAEALSLPEKIVRNLISHIQGKLNTHSFASAISRAVELGEIDLYRTLPSDFDPEKLTSLNSKEAEIFIAIANEGLSNKQIAVLVERSTLTIKNKIAAIMDKTGLIRREQFVGAYLIAKQKGIELEAVPEKKIEIGSSGTNSRVVFLAE